MELASYRNSLDSLESYRSPSTIQRLRHRLVDTFERLSSPRSPSLGRRSTFSSQPFDVEDSEHHANAVPQAVSFASLRFLQRVEAVRLQHSIRKHGHRFYVMHVYLRSTRIPIYRRDPNHSVENAYASFFELRDAIHEHSLLTAEDCETCLRCLAAVREIRDSAHDVKRVLRSSKEKEEGVERFIHCFIEVFSSRETSVCLCIGCQHTIEALAKVLRRKYLQTTGII